MNKAEHLLTTAAEECMEVAQRISKALRFGLNEVQPGQSLSNAQRIIYEYNDLVAVMDMLEREGLVPPALDTDQIEAKRDKVLKYMQYAKDIGTISV